MAMYMLHNKPRQGRGVRGNYTCSSRNFATTRDMRKIVNFLSSRSKLAKSITEIKIGTGISGCKVKDGVNFLLRLKQIIEIHDNGSTTKYKINKYPNE